LKETKGFPKAVSIFTEKEKAGQFLEKNRLKESPRENLPKAKKRKVSHHKCYIRIHFDGGARGNPGTAGSGAQLVFIDEAFHGKKKILNLRKYIVKATNNVAEYQGLLIGLKKAYSELKNFIDSKKGCSCSVEFEINGDSLIVINQLKGIYQCKAQNLKPLYEEAKNIIAGIEKIADANFSFQHVYRKDNSIADCLANEAMDERRSWDTLEGDVKDAPKDDTARPLAYSRQSRLVRKVKADV